MYVCIYIYTNIRVCDHLRLSTKLSRIHLSDTSPQAYGTRSYGPFSGCSRPKCLSRCCILCSGMTGCFCQRHSMNSSTSKALKKLLLAALSFCSLRPCRLRSLLLKQLRKQFCLLGLCFFGLPPVLLLMTTRFSHCGAWCLFDYDVAWQQNFQQRYQITKLAEIAEAQPAIVHHATAIPGH